MAIFSRRSGTDSNQQEREIQSAKREGARLQTSTADRISNGTASREDKRVFNAGRTRSGRIK